MALDRVRQRDEAAQLNATAVANGQKLFQRLDLLVGALNAARANAVASVGSDNVFEASDITDIDALLALLATRTDTFRGTLP